MPNISGVTVGAVAGVALALGLGLGATVTGPPATAHINGARIDGARIGGARIGGTPAGGLHARGPHTGGLHARGPHTGGPAAARLGRPGIGLAQRPVLAAGRPAARAGLSGGSIDSLNSAGYAVSQAGTRFRLVRATFFVPYLNCALSPGSFSADWVGLGGFVGKSVSVQQDGIEADCPASGRASYFAWFRMYPRGRARSKIQVRGGDSVTASVFYDTARRRFTLAVTNNTTGGHLRAHRTCPSGVTCPARSGEIISSAPVTGTGRHLTIKPLADYGAVSFTSIAITNRSGQRGGLRSPHWTATRIVQTERDAPFRLIARPTQVEADTFDNYWSRAS